MIQPHRDLTAGAIVSIPPDSWFIDFVDVPPGYTNLTFFATNLPPIFFPPSQLKMYEKFNAEPPFTDFDFEADLTNTFFPGGDPGNSISIGPPLDIGKYFIGIFNSSSNVSANVYILARLGLDKNANDQFTYADTGPEPIPPDVVAAICRPSLFPPTQLIESVNVGMVIDSPQISDMTFGRWSVRPASASCSVGESRYQLAPTGRVAPLSPPISSTSTAAGGAAANSTIPWPLPGYAITIPITYNMYTVPDEMTVYAGKDPTTFYFGSPTFLHDTGFTNLAGSFNVTVQPGFTNVTIIMNQFGNPFVDGGGDAWIYTAGAANTNFEYLTFTDDSNLANVPD